MSDSKLKKRNELSLANKIKVIHQGLNSENYCYLSKAAKSV